METEYTLWPLWQHFLHALNKISCRALWTFYVSDVKMNISRVCGSSQLKGLPLLLTWDWGLTVHSWLILKQFEKFLTAVKMTALFSLNRLQTGVSWTVVMVSSGRSGFVHALDLLFPHQTQFKDVLKTLAWLPRVGLPHIYTQKQSFKWSPLKHFPFRPEPRAQKQRRPKSVRLTRRLDR